MDRCSGRGVCSGEYAEYPGEDGELISSSYRSSRSQSLFHFHRVYPHKLSPTMWRYLET